jgi:hypothetical protein
MHEPPLATYIVSSRTDMNTTIPAPATTAAAADHDAYIVEVSVRTRCRPDALLARAGKVALRRVLRAHACIFHVKQHGTTTA